jgi:ABC-type methionine transport system ATPase subunit
MPRVPTAQRFPVVGGDDFSVLACAPPAGTLAIMQITRLWLMFPARLITRPVLWELTKKFEVVTNIRQASVTEEIGLVSLELEGERDEIKKTISWLEEQGIKVEPVEINTIEG